MKTCASCLMEKDQSQFHRRTASKDGLYSYCKPCNTIKSRELYQRSEKVRSSARERHLQTAYGMSPAEVEEMFNQQDQCCAICSRSLAEIRRLVVDHDHATGKVRGGLCDRCNTNLGWLEQFSGEVGEYLGRSPASD